MTRKERWSDCTFRKEIHNGLLKAYKNRVYALTDGTMSVLFEAVYICFEAGHNL